jgi:hypothetical protein
VYAFFYEPGVSIDGKSCIDYCGYHTYASGPGFNKPYMVIPYCPGNGCGGASNDAYTIVTSHELQEATTDPYLNKWFADSGNENADNCNWKSVTVSIPNPPGSATLASYKKSQDYENFECGCSAWFNTPFTNRVVRSRIGTCLDSYGGGVGAQLRQYSCNGGGNQLFTTDGYNIRVNGLCMDAFKDSPVNGDAVRLYTCGEGDHQQFFEFQGSNNGQIRFHTREGGLKCVNIPAGNTANGVGLIFWDCVSSSNELFYI